GDLSLVRASLPLADLEGGGPRRAAVAGGVDRSRGRAVVAGRELALGQRDDARARDRHAHGRDLGQRRALRALARARLAGLADLAPGADAGDLEAERAAAGHPELELQGGAGQELLAARTERGQHRLDGVRSRCGRETRSGGAAARPRSYSRRPRRRSYRP